MDKSTRVQRSDDSSSQISSFMSLPFSSPLVRARWLLRGVCRWPPFSSSAPPAATSPSAPAAPPCGAELSSANEQLVALTSAIEQLCRGLPDSDNVEEVRTKQSVDA